MCTLNHRFRKHKLVVVVVVVAMSAIFTTVDIISYVNG